MARKVLHVILKQKLMTMSFVDIMSGITAVGDAESESWTFADALARANLSVETLAEGVLNRSHSPTPESSFFIPH